MSFDMTGVCKKIKKQTVLDDINISVDNGQCCGFIGRNGCGKTMLLRAAAGYMQVYGSVTWNNSLIGNGIFIKNAGIIIGETDFIGDLSGFQNLKMLAEINGSIDVKRIIEVMKIIRIYDDKDKKYKYYSLGMKQRLRIAQAIMEYPEILILDEPFNGLDKNGREEILKLLKGFKQDGTTILLTSHIESDIKRLCDKICEMENGKIVREVNI